VTEETPIQPVATPEHLENATLAEKGDFYSRCVFLLAIIIGLAALAMSAVAFAGFAENDQNFTHLLSAFGLCFGIGALAYGPMGLIALYARKAIHHPMPRFRSVIVLLLMLPWFFLAWLVFKLGENWRLIAVLGVLTALFISVWAVRFLKAK